MKKIAGKYLVVIGFIFVISALYFELVEYYWGATLIIPGLFCSVAGFRRMDEDELRKYAEGTQKMD
jgi:hypothetical protein